MSKIILRPGEIIADRYKIINYLAEGGMQKVFYTHDIKLNRFVALKVPKNASAEKRFERSAILSAKINHPHVAKTLDYFEFEDYPYLIEEFIEGTDLKNGLLDKFEAIDPYICARILHYLAKGLAASHHAGVRHRDIKPSNVMIVGGYNLKEIKITDFGIAKMAEEEIAVAAEGGEESITASKTMVGALPYMAPEMIENPRKTDTPADIWSLGALTYELLSGNKPYGVGLKAVPKIIAAEPPEMPTYVKKSNLQFKILGEQIYTIICSCMNKKASKRPTADELVRTCEEMCYPISERQTGFVNNIKYHSWGFITAGEDKVFFHFASVYGPPVKINDDVCFSKFPGEPQWRAHPILRLKSD